MVKRLSNTNQNSNKLINVPTPVDPGDAANKAYVDSQSGGGTDVVRSTTTDWLTASGTEPSSPATGDVWIDTANLPDNLAPNTIVWKETPAGSVNGTNFQFQTSQPYVSGTLQVFVNGLAQSGFILETGAGSGVFELDTPPQTGDNIRVQYQVRSTATGNAATLNNVSMQGLLEALYPIGAVYVSGSSTMPSLIDSIGTWTRLKGRFIVGLDEDQTEFDTIDETGGAKTHLHGLASGAACIGSGQGNANSLGFTQSQIGVLTGSMYTIGNTASATASGHPNRSHNTALTGTTDSASGLPPYKAKYMWERTA